MLRIYDHQKHQRDFLTEMVDLRKCCSHEALLTSTLDFFWSELLYKSVKND